jgi:hypothetical protein
VRELLCQSKNDKEVVAAAAVVAVADRRKKREMFSMS